MGFADTPRCCYSTTIHGRRLRFVFTEEILMSDMHRRAFLSGTAGSAAAAVLAGSGIAAAGDPSFMNNVPDPVLSGKELPTFKFALEKSEGKVIGNSYGK